MVQDLHGESVLRPLEGSLWEGQCASPGQPHWDRAKGFVDPWVASHGQVGGAGGGRRQTRAPGVHRLRDET